MLDRRKKAQAKGEVRRTLVVVLDRGPPDRFDEALYKQICDPAFLPPYGELLRPRSKRLRRGVRSVVVQDDHVR